MRRFVTLVMFGAALASSAASAHAGGTVRVPVLLELFTSEGCSSCPPADELLESLDRTQPIQGADLIVLSEHVDYWDRLGWKDPFSSPDFTARQSTYAREIDGSDNVYTPEIVIDGRTGVIGSDNSAVRAAVERATQIKKHQLAITAVSRGSDAAFVHIDAAPPGVRGAALYVAVAIDHVQSRVLAGENAGRTLSHVAVVRRLQLVDNVPARGPISRVVTIPLQGVSADSVRIVAWIQETQTGAILAIAGRRLAESPH